MEVESAILSCKNHTPSDLGQSRNPWVKSRKFHFEYVFPFPEEVETLSVKSKVQFWVVEIILPAIWGKVEIHGSKVESCILSTFFHVRRKSKLHLWSPNCVSISDFLGGLEAGCCDPHSGSHTSCRIQQPGLPGAAKLLQQSVSACKLQWHVFSLRQYCCAGDSRSLCFQKSCFTVMSKNGRNSCPSERYFGVSLQAGHQLLDGSSTS